MHTLVIYLAGFQLGERRAIGRSGGECEVTYHYFF
jgi:hypothetical protein